MEKFFLHITGVIKLPILGGIKQYKSMVLVILRDFAKIIVHEAWVGVIQ